MYKKGTAIEILPNADSWPVAKEGAPEIQKDSFTIKFMRQGDTAYIEGYPVNAGTYDVTITRPHRQGHPCHRADGLHHGG